MSGLSAIDQFCGAGGSSLGALLAGIDLKVALNHDWTAIQTHAANFPETHHECVDVACVDPRWYPPTDILITSPECRAHSYASGRPKDDPSLFDPNGDKTAERSRATMWDVPRFAEVHDYRVVVVENVVQAVEWGPRDNKGSQFRAWLYAMEGLGYEHELVSFNSMFAPPTPQSRDRLYVVFWKKGQARPDLRFDVTAWCPACERFVEAAQSWKRLNPYIGKHVGRYGSQYVYACPECSSRALPLVTPAAAAIDWTLPATRIGDRTRPLASATIARIRRGLERLGERPRVVAVGGNLFERPGYSRTWPTDHPMPTLPYLLVAEAFVVPLRNGKQPDSIRARDVGEPLPTQTGRQELGLAIVDLRGENCARGLEEPLSTVCAGGNHHALVVSNYGPGRGGKWPGGWEPIGTVTSRDGHALVLAYNRTAIGRDITEPMATVTTVDPHALVEAAATRPDVDDCGFRMLEPHEIARAMVMDRHADGREYVVIGTKRDRVKQYGNAVTPPVMRLILDRCVESLEQR